MRNLRMHHLFLIEHAIMKFGVNPKIQFEEQYLDISSGKLKVRRRIAEVYLDLMQKPDLEFRLTRSADYICKACENNYAGKCTRYDNGKLRLKDGEFSQKYGLSYGIHSAGEITDAIVQFMVQDSKYNGAPQTAEAIRQPKPAYFSTIFAQRDMVEQLCYPETTLHPESALHFLARPKPL